jgi:uncharacterized protein (DUF2267 family)
MTVSSTAGDAMATLAYGQLLQGVEMAAGLDRAASERIVRATLATLAERLGRKDFAALAARLPDELRQVPDEATDEPAPFAPEEFVRRAARRAGIGQESAWVQSRAVLATLRQSVAEMESVRSRLQDYDSLMA